MANYNVLLATISAAIRANGNEEITGQLLQGVLLTMVNKLGDGYQFGGIATPSGTPTADADARVFYLAFQSGTYIHYGGLVVPAGMTVIAHSDIWQILGTYTTPSDVFIATHGSTTYAQVTAAVNAGKPVFVYYSNRLYELVGRNNELSYVFVCPFLSTLYYLALPTNSAWGGGSSVEMQRVANIEQSVSTSTIKYPSSKAVKDYVDAHGGGTPVEVNFAGADEFDDPSYWSYAEAASIGLTSDAIYNMITKHAPMIDSSDPGGLRWLNYSISHSTLSPDPNNMENEMYDIYIQWISNNASQIRMRSLHIYNEPEDGLYVYDHTVSLT